MRYGKLWHPAAKVRDALSLALARVADPGGRPARLGVPGEQDRAPCSLELGRADPRLRLGNEAMVFLRIWRNRAPVEVSAEALMDKMGCTRQVDLVRAGLATL